MTQATEVYRGRYKQIYLTGEELSVLQRVADRNDIVLSHLLVRIIRAFCRETLKREREAARVRRDRS